jgi:hypothetical protein
MFGLTGWMRGDPLTTEMEAIDAAVRSDGPALDEAVKGLTVAELMELAAAAQRVADRCTDLAGGGY